MDSKKEKEAKEVKELALEALAAYGDAEDDGARMVVAVQIAKLVDRLIASEKE